MAETRTPRFLVIAVLLLLGVLWSLTAAGSRDQGGYPNGRFLATADWLKGRLADKQLVVVDVREEKHLDGTFIPGSIRMEWKQFQEADTARGIGGRFIGPDRAQALLGKHGIARTDTVVLYDTLKRDGGATSSYVFWVLDLLGHRDVRVLERGIEAWKEAGGQTVAAPRTAPPLLYQAPAEELRLDRWASGDFILKRLGDPYYQILDVRSPEEYRGEAANQGLDGAPLKLGHIPTAFNLDYTLNWTNRDAKRLKPYAELQTLYAGLDPNRTVVAYCHSGRRGSFTYFTLRLMGFERVALYDASWFEWGNQQLFFPTETRANPLSGARPGASSPAGKVPAGPGKPTPSPAKAGSASTGGYISCGG